MSEELTPPSIEEVCERARRLPCSPALLPKLSAILQRDDSTAEEIEAVIVTDPPLTAATLRLANSVYFGSDSGARVGTVADAVLRLGQREVYKLAALVLIERWDELMPKGLTWEPGDFCRHALCTGLAAEVLAEKTGKVDSNLAYTGGLLCDLGKLALAHSCAEFYPAIRQRCDEGQMSWEKAEAEVLGYHHAEVSAMLLKDWRFPELLTAAAEFQTDPQSAPQEVQPMLAHLHAAKYLATTLGPGVVEDGFLFALHGEFLTEWGFTPELLEESMPVLLERASVRLKSKLSHGAMSLD